MTMVSRRPRPAALERDLGYNIYRLSQLVRDEMLAQLKALDPDLTPEQWHLLLCLADAPAGMTPSALSLAGLRDKTTISRMLDVIEKHDLIERIRRDGDGRSYLVRLSVKSRQLIDLARATRQPLAADRVFDALSGAEHDLLLALLQKCRRTLGDM